MTSEHINELATALAKAQGSIPNATLNRINPHFKSKYADLSSVLDAIRAPLAANGLSVTQTIEPAAQGMRLVTTLMHSSGQFITSEYPLPATARPQEMGSALTYARRYSLAAMICNAADEDDDGNAAQTAKPNGNGGGKVTPEQVKHLLDRIEAVGADHGRFLKYLKINDLSHLPASDFDGAMAKLEAKTKRKLDQDGCSD